MSTKRVVTKLYLPDCIIPFKSFEILNFDAFYEELVESSLLIEIAI